MTWGATRAAIMYLVLVLCACDERVGSIILFRNGEMQTSSVYRVGSTCWAAWFEGIEKLVLRSDRTAAREARFNYTWTLVRRGPDDPAADLAWFHANCLDPGFLTP